MILQPGSKMYWATRTRRAPGDDGGNGEGTGDGGGTGAAGGSAGEGSGSSGSDGQGDKDGAGDSGDSKKPEEKPVYSKAQLEALVEDRLKRDRDSREKKAAEEQRKRDEEALAAQNQFKELADTRQKRIDELEPLAAELEVYKTALQTHLEKAREGLPDSVVKLLDKLPAPAQLEWIAENADTFRKEGDSSQESQKVTKGVKETPKGESKNGKDPLAAYMSRAYGDPNKSK